MMEFNLEIFHVCVLNVGHLCTTGSLGGTEVSSPFARLYYLTRGTATIHLPNKDIQARAGYMYLIPSFLPHSYTCNDGCEFYYLFVYERTGKQSDIFDYYSFPHEVEANHAIDLLFQNYCNFYPELNLPYESEDDFYSHPSYYDYVTRYSQMDRFEKMQLLGFVWIVASFFMKHAGTKLNNIDTRILKVMTYVREHLGDVISLEDLAQQVSVTKSHLARMFRQAFNISPSQYVIRTKVQSAQRLLMTTNHSIRYIASEVGYSDVSYFIRVFKRSIGMTPQEYRAQLKY